MPKYVSQQVGGEPHAPIWKSTVLVGGLTGDSGARSSKTLAELSAAESILEKIRNSETVKSVTVPTNTVLLVDLENLPTIAAELFDYSISFPTYVFIGSSNPRSTVSLPDTITKVLVPTQHRDGVDCAIQVKVGELLPTTDNFLIATRDHFAAALVDIITVTYGKTAKIIFSLGDI
jgi:hypothetical protein